MNTFYLYLRTHIYQCHCHLYDDHQQVSPEVMLCLCNAWAEVSDLPPPRGSCLKYVFKVVCVSTHPSRTPPLYHELDRAGALWGQRMGWEVPLWFATEGQGVCVCVCVCVCVRVCVGGYIYIYI